jgi:hypothetical protein
MLKCLPIMTWVACMRIRRPYMKIYEAWPKERYIPLPGMDCKTMNRSHCLNRVKHSAAMYIHTHFARSVSNIESF